MQRNTGAKTLRGFTEAAAKQEFLFFVKIIEGIITIFRGVKV